MRRFMLGVVLVGAALAALPAGAGAITTVPQKLRLFDPEIAGQAPVGTEAASTFTIDECPTISDVVLGINGRARDAFASRSVIVRAPCGGEGAGSIVRGAIGRIVLEADGNAVLIARPRILIETPQYCVYSLSRANAGFTVPTLPSMAALEVAGEATLPLEPDKSLGVECEPTHAFAIRDRIFDNSNQDWSVGGEG